MVRARSFRRFWRDTAGLSLVEAMLTMPVVMLVVAAMVECGVAMFQWNQTVKALQVGARFVAVSSPLANAADMATLVADYPAAAGGSPVPAAIVTVSCGAGVTPCETAAMTRLMTGGDGVCGAAPIGGPVGICDVAPFLTQDNIRVTYYRAGLGYVGRPQGPVVTVRLEAVNLTFDFMILDALIPTLNTIRIPAHPVTVTGEDLNDCEDTCP